MTSHLTDAGLATMLERDDSVNDELRSHLEECDECRAALAAARAQLTETAKLLEMVTVAPPDIDAAEFVKRLAARTSITKVDPWRRRLRLRRLARDAVAAAILTGSVAAAALVPNSALGRLVHAVAVASRITSDQPSTAPEKSNRSQSLARGVEISPHGRVEVLFRSGQSAGAIRVVRATVAELSVAGTADGPAYTVGNNSIIVTNHASDSLSYVVGIPALSDSDAVYITVAGKSAYSKVGNQVIAPLGTGHGGQIVLRFRDLQ